MQGAPELMRARRSALKNREYREMQKIKGKEIGFFGSCSFSIDPALKIKFRADYC